MARNIAGRIAYREISLYIGWCAGDYTEPSTLRQKKVKWSMEPRFTPTGEAAPRFRGSWAAATQPENRNWFAESTEWNREYFYFESNSATKAETQTFRGNTGVRVNMPPWGLNKGCVMIEIEGVNEGNPVALADFMVQPVVVIDPGHGGKDSGTDACSRAAQPAALRYLHEEKYVNLDVATRLRDCLLELRKTQMPNLQVYMTRDDDTFVEIPDRQIDAKNKGADIFLSIHCNSDKRVEARRVESFVQWYDQGNIRFGEDAALGVRINNAVHAALLSFDAQTPNEGVRRHPKYVNGLGVLRDAAKTNGNQRVGGIDYHPMRAVLAELEFITNTDGDALLISGKQVDPPNPARYPQGSWTSDAVRQRIADELAPAIINDLRAQPNDLLYRP